MEQALQNNSIKFLEFVRMLSIIALLFTILGNWPNLFYYHQDGIWVEDSSYCASYWQLQGDPHLVFSFYTPNLFNAFLSLIPSILMVLYGFKFYLKIKLKTFVTIFFSVLSLLVFFEMFLSPEFGSVSLCLGWRSEVPPIFNIPYILLLALPVIPLLKGFHSKLFIKISTISCTALLLLESISTNINCANSKMFLTNFLFLPHAGLILVLISLLLLYLKNPTLVFDKKRTNPNKSTFSPEAELKLLKEKFELGAITEEEYAAQRAKIISKL